MATVTMSLGCIVQNSILAKYLGKKPFEIIIESEKFELSNVPPNEVTEQEFLDY